MEEERINQILKQIEERKCQLETLKVCIGEHSVNVQNLKFPSCLFVQLKELEGVD